MMTYIDMTPEESHGHLAENPELLTMDARITGIEEHLDKLTGAVNQFGVMLQSIVDNVSSMSQAIQKGGIGGIMALMGGKKND